MKKIILISAICAICTQVQSQSWNLTGNAGTDPAVNFIGTTDNKNFKIRTNNVIRMSVTTSGKVAIGNFTPVFKLDVKGSINTDSLYRIGGNTVLSIKGSGNFFAGVNSGFSNTTGFSNTASGNGALFSNTAGNYNTASGGGALYSNNTGTGNTADGLLALNSNVKGNNGVAVGAYSQLYANDIAQSWDNTNTSIGYQSLRGSITPANNYGAANTAIGRDALYSNSSGFSNTANGYKSLYSNTEGNYNTANGWNTLYSNSIGEFNVATGGEALYFNTVGSQNTANGYGALTYNENGVNNTANGFSALYINEGGSYNTAGGAEALVSSYGWYNTANGAGALNSNTSGGNNTAIGYNSNVSIGQLTNATAVGSLATVNADNKVRIGDADVTVVEGQVAYSWPSDGRFKENVKEDVKGLDFIMKLQPVSYNFNRLKFAQHIRQQLTPGKEKTLVEKSQIRSVGFIAQDVEKIIQQTGFTSFDAVHAPANETDNYSMGYAEFVVPLVKAVQELNEDLKSEAGSLKSDLSRIYRENEQLQKENIQIKNDISEMKAALGLKSKSSDLILPASDFLEQNQPNPFNEQTVIRYSVVSQFNSAIIQISDYNNRVLKTVVINQTEKGELIIHAGELVEGAYQYFLIVDGKVVDTKHMVLTK